MIHCIPGVDTETVDSHSCCVVGSPPSQGPSRFPSDWAVCVPYLIGFYLFCFVLFSLCCGFYETQNKPVWILGAEEAQRSVTWPSPEVHFLAPLLPWSHCTQASCVITRAVTCRALWCLSALTFWQPLSHSSPPPFSIPKQQQQKHCLKKWCENTKLLP